jgi:hypothetical protein
MLTEIERETAAHELLRTLDTCPIQLGRGEGILLQPGKAPERLPASLVSALGGDELEPGFVLCVLVIGGHMALTAVPLRPCQAPGAC